MKGQIRDHVEGTERQLAETAKSYGQPEQPKSTKVFRGIATDLIDAKTGQPSKMIDVERGR